jgi:A/G-specific adenine glycosylase
VGAVDTNVRRVLTRAMTGTSEAIPSAEVQRLADAAVPRDRPADWTHAVMDVGATFCRPTRPDCDACPARAWCRYARGERGAPLVAAPRPRSAAGPAFSASSRWLRGRILDRLRDAPPPGWDRFDGAIGEHADEAVLGTLVALAAEGLAEVDPADRRLARLPER